MFPEKTEYLFGGLTGDRACGDRVAATIDEGGAYRSGRLTFTAPRHQFIQDSIFSDSEKTESLFRKDKILVQKDRVFIQKRQNPYLGVSPETAPAGIVLRRSTRAAPAVWYLGFRVKRLGFRAWGLELRVEDGGLRVEG